MKKLNLNIINKKKLLYLGVLLLLVGIVVASIPALRTTIQNVSNKQPQGACSGENNKDIQNDSVVYLDMTNDERMDMLGDVVPKIQALKAYDKDPNCLYPVIAYQLHTGDTAAARETLNKIKPIYNSDAGFSDKFTYQQTYDQLEQRVLHLERSEELINQNVFYFDEGVEPENAN